MFRKFFSNRNVESGIILKIKIEKWHNVLCHFQDLKENVSAILILQNFHFHQKLHPYHVLLLHNLIFLSHR